LNAESVLGICYKHVYLGVAGGILEADDRVLK
jgi:hypothetical protein